MSDGWLANTVISTTTDVPGRTLNAAGVHHFIIDGPSKPNEEIVSMEAFLAAISSCATHLIEQFAEDDGEPLDSARVTITGYRPSEDLSRFDHIDLQIELHGPTQTQAEQLADRFKGR